MMILHVPYHFDPNRLGGTEIYAHALAAGLQRNGTDTAIAAPGPLASSFYHESVPVHVFATAARPGLQHAYGLPDEEAARSFDDLLERTSPEIVHLHARTAAVSSALIERAHDRGARVVFTYHTPTVSCARGTMLLYGRTRCDGRLDIRRCGTCLLSKHGVPRAVGSLLMKAPPRILRAADRGSAQSQISTALRVPELLASQIHGTRQFLDQADHVVAVCDWVAEVLRGNGVSENRLTVSRQGLAHGSDLPQVPLPDGPGPLRIGYFGRLDQTKGVETLISAVRRATVAAVQLRIFGVVQVGGDVYSRRLRTLAQGDSRIVFADAVPAKQVVKHMQTCHVVAVPSLWLETGPLVVLEAFAAGRPIIGSRLGGITELVTDGRDGVLLPPGDVAAWASSIEELASSRERLAALAAGVRPPRTMDDAVADMMELYRKLARTGAVA